MKKTIALGCFIALTGISSAAFAQSKNKKSSPIVLKTKSDTISYALAQYITTGLKQHVLALGVLKDTTEISLIDDYELRFENADDAGKAALKKEYEQKKKETIALNDANLAAFTKGAKAALTAIKKEENSYNAGIGIGNQLRTVREQFEKDVLDGESLDNNIFSQSFIAAFQEEEPLIDNAGNLIQQLAAEKQQAEEIAKAEELKAAYGDKISEGVQFLAENKQKEGVVTLPSGLQYKVIEEGTGEIPFYPDQVTVHYEGRLLDGTVFDSSYQRGEPATFGVGQVIKGWTEALLIMPKGSKWTVYIPYDLAYGDRDQGVIKPYSTLIFDIELIDVIKK